MDLDVFVAVHNDEWRRLEDLLKRRRRLTGAEADELVELYEHVSTHLSVVRSTAPDPGLITRLSTLVARARSAITGAHTPAWRDIARFVLVVFPAVTYRYRWWLLFTSLGSVLVSVVVAGWLVSHPQLLTEIAPPDVLEEYAEKDFAAYYGEHPASSFASRVWTNNVWVAAQALAFGVLLGIPTVIVLVQNMASLGVSAAIMTTYGQADVFFGLITPHGLLELTAVFLAGAAGLKLGWSIIDPGPRRRLEALASEGRAAVSITLGLVGVLLVSGIVEAFVTPSPLPTWARIAIGVFVEVAFLVYVFTLGRRAVQAGETGDLLREQREDVLPSAG
ncbi:MAG: stage II sporulation protein M [Streptosporangiales bacterium]|nr:stage II sporulation protein M [Streptosporangiales bacterium]